MLEGLAAWVLNNYLGKYVENLNTAQLSIALLSGEVELENLPLDKDGLRHLGLPFNIKSGFIGKIKLQIPVRQLRSAPWVIVIKQLYLVATPLPVHDWDATAEELSSQEQKIRSLDDLEVRWRLENDAQENNSTYYASSYSYWLSYGTGFITNIIENLQLKIHDVHFRYEDDISIPGQAVAFGLTMESLSAQSCDENWQPGFSQWDGSSLSFKLLEMQKLAVYWTLVDRADMFSAMDQHQLATAMSCEQSSQYDDTYILAPVSARAYIKRNRSQEQLRSVETPRLVCDLQLDEVPLILVDWQYDQIVKCIRGLDDVARFRAYKRFRPLCPVAEDARAWWLYAVSCLYPGGQPNFCRPKPTWETSLRRAKENVAYVEIYNKILVSPASALQPDEKEIKDDVEWSREFDELKVLRDLAMRKVPEQKRNATSNSSTGRTTSVRWFPQWKGWYSSPDTEVTTPTNETEKLEDEILEVLTDTIDNNTMLRRDVVFGTFSFTLKSGTLNLCTADESKQRVSMMELEFKNLYLNVISKPRTSSHLVELSLDALYLHDKFTPNTQFPILVGPPGQERTAPIIRQKTSTTTKPEGLFYLVYEKRPENVNCDYRLCLKTKSLDVVYQPAAVRWLTEFLCLPHQRTITQSRIEEMKSRTKKELIKNWEQILDGRVVDRSSWDLQFDITAPQIFLVEQFNDPNAAIAVIDFGRLHLRNNVDNINAPSSANSRKDDDEEMFMTPCSTPPASEESDSDQIPYDKNWEDGLDHYLLHMKIYDVYTVDLTDMQILIAKVKDNWRYAHNKGTSTLHVLDRFNISLQIERRVIHTHDPQYPSLTLNANLPKLVVHLNEQKISSARKLAQIISATGLPSPFNSPETSIEETILNVKEDDDSLSYDMSAEKSRLLQLQFTVDQLSLEVQSRGRSVAELQVSGVKLEFIKRPLETNATLSVHSLLLVDALQTFGQDFELLVASHKHVGMDSLSGSLKDSEPTSPTSPGSPDPTIPRLGATSPVALTQVLSNLAASPQQLPWPRIPYPRNVTILDAEALITLELLLVFGAEPIQVANIQFNNLDIIANQETIVELMGFIRRVFPELKSQKPSNVNLPHIVPSSVHNSLEQLIGEETQKKCTTKIMFDFHRLNVLLLRGVFKDGHVQGKKICTATMSEAKIEASVGEKVIIKGSLGGLQVLDLTPEGQMHQRIISVGRDPLQETSHQLYLMSSTSNVEGNTAFSFKIVRSLQSSNCETDDSAEITVRMASLWYTHSPQFLMELQSCATEFKQYLANLARSIKSAATDMALGLVHARAEALAQSIYMNSRLSSSIYGSALSFTDISSPRRRRRSSSMDQSYSGYSSARDTVPQTPYSPIDDDDYRINLQLDIELETPVLVLPRAYNSPQVFVAHLGKIRVSNNDPYAASSGFETEEVKTEYFDIEVRDMNLFSLDTSSRRTPAFIPRPEILYSCNLSGKPILHDTVLQLRVCREIPKRLPSRQTSVSNLLLDDDDKLSLDGDADYGTENVEVTGVVKTLKVSLTRAQYEQLLDTVQWLTSSKGETEVTKISRTTLANISEEDTGVTTLKMDPHVRAKLFPNVTLPRSTSTQAKSVSVKVQFEFQIFTIELRGDTPQGEQGLVDLSFRDFIFDYDKSHLYETNIHVSLRSIFMEDLLKPEGSKQRAMVISSSGDDLPVGAACVSRSCPDIYGYLHNTSPTHGSLPDHLETNRLLGMERSNTVHVEPCTNGNMVCPSTPPPSPSTRTRPVKNLVLVTTLLVDPSAPNFKTKYNSLARSTSVDFNCLDLVINVESWVVVIDFFSASPTDTVDSGKFNKKKRAMDISQIESGHENVETNITVRSLTMVLVRPDRDVAKANISNIEISIKTNGTWKEVEGRLGSMSLIDLTLHGQLYRERFLTSGKQALKFKYFRHGSNEIEEYDAQLTLNMSSVFYVHTKRFVSELQAFFNHFSQLQAVMSSIRAATSGKKITDEISRLSLVLNAESPVILLPVSSKNSQLIIVDLGELKVTNCFKFSGDEGTISVNSHYATDRKCLLDVMYLDLLNVNLQTGERFSDLSAKDRQTEYYKLGNCIIKRSGPSLLTEKCHLRIQVERNLHSSFCHNVPDMSIHGELSTLDGTLDLSEYKLIRGFLAHNLGENTEHILSSVQPPPISAEPNIHDKWTLSSLRLDLLNVTVRLREQQKSIPLACINFIKSRLTVEGYSNFSQDIDLVSQEILIMDTRYNNVPHNKRSNVFTNILQPIKLSKNKSVVQVEVHSQRRADLFKFTILLNNMRLMAVFDWWEHAKEFIFQEIDEIPISPTRQRTITNETKKEGVPFELKLNITDSEVVVVEDTSVWDTNAVIFKSTTVISYRSAMIEKPLSCNLNNCEVYSCILGMEEETALSIIDPITLNIEVNQERVLDFQLHTLTVRLSYYDMRMFMQILNSLPKQLFDAKKPETPVHSSVQKNIDKLVALGFDNKDCITALELCGHKLDDAALWLTHNATSNYEEEESPMNIIAIEVQADNIFLCIIDDCGDVDVPLLEVSLSKFNLRQYLSIKSIPEGAPEGALECILATDYYNRVLSGWEPIIEPWKAMMLWHHTLSQGVTKNRLQIDIDSKQNLNVNITSTLIELFKQVKDRWTQDLYSNKEAVLTKNVSLPAGYRSRSPFIPYALKNETGSELSYSTLITEMDRAYDRDYKNKFGESQKFISVKPGETAPFSFNNRDKIRHSDSHKRRILQLGVQIEGFQDIAPVTVDKVGVYFRHAPASIHTRSQKEIPIARVVFDVALEGSARKLVTVRSALLIINKLSETIEVKLDSRIPHNETTLWAASKTIEVKTGETLSVPLIHAHSGICVRPLHPMQVYTFSSPQIFWDYVNRTNEISYESKICHSNRGKVYRFCAEIKRENYPLDRSSQRIQPAHTITILPMVLLINLLPIDIHFLINEERGCVGAGGESALTTVNTENLIELKLTLENFPTSNTLVIQPGTTQFSYRIRLEDNSNRKLYLTAVVVPHSDSSIKIIVSAPYWIINKTGLPLVFRQGGVSAETAGQFEENEVARSLTPLLFSFSDPDASNTILARVGTHVIPNGNAQWCQNFHLQRGVQVRKLRVSLKDGRPDVVFVIGIEVRQGKGKYLHTKIVTISPRYQLHNKSSYKLLFAQSCFAGNISDANANVQYLKALPECYMPFHWPRLDQEQLLCVLIQDIPDCMWSGGLKIDSNYSMHVNVRDINARMYFLRLEVVLQGATFFIVFTDADLMPPPLRVDNCSEVPIRFMQTCCKDIVHSTARAHSSVPYVWDHPTKTLELTLETPGGLSQSYDVDKLGIATGLTYENFIYIAFTETFRKSRDTIGMDLETQELVLDVNNINRVVLARKEQGRRSQLWRMTSTGQLQHEGSSPPHHPNQTRTNDKMLVLDIDGPAPQPSLYSTLVIRRPDPRRKSTQTWRFTDEGRLCCVHHNMCVQAQDGFFGLRMGNGAVLGLPQRITHRVSDSGIPFEQAVQRQRLRPGSGFLTVELVTDGPTRVIRIKDEQMRVHSYATTDERDWSNIAEKQRPNLKYEDPEERDKQRELQVTWRLSAVGVNLISRRPPQELLYAQFTNIVGEVLLMTKLNRFCISMGDIQIDNQLFDVPTPIFLCVTPIRASNDAEAKLPSLDIRAEMQSITNENAVIFNHFIVRLKKLTVNLEEKLLLKLFEFVGYNSQDEQLCNADENDHETQRMLTQVSAAHATRYYFGILQLVPDQIRLSMKTSTKLPKSLISIKRKLGFTFIKFEDAGVDLEPYIRQHTFESFQFLANSVVKHFKDELVWQAGIILGSVDFLGNPLGFMNDVSEGVSGLIKEGNVGALVKNVTHGISNSAAKVTESLSDGLGRVTMDEEHEEMRQRIRQVDTGKSKDHLMAGMKGLAFGLLGGATGIFKQVYEGATSEGIPGVFTGIGKGIVGAVTKPVVGVLDLASETARAVRDSSKGSNRMLPAKMRPLRCVTGPGGLLPRYNAKQSLGQQFLYAVNDRNYNEQLVAYENLRSGSEDLRVIISNEAIRIVTSANPSTLTTVIESYLSDLQKCRIIQENESGENRYYIELTIRRNDSSMAYVYPDAIKKPKVRCDSNDVAKTVARQINYAKRLYEERQHTLLSDNITQNED